MHIAQLELAQALPGLLLQRPNALHAVNLADQLGEHRRLVAGTGTYFQYPLARPRRQQQFRHPRHDVGLRQGLLEADGKSHILVGAMRHGLIQEQVPRRTADDVQHLGAGYPLLHQALNQALPGAL